VIAQTTESRVPATGSGGPPEPGPRGYDDSGPARRPEARSANPIARLARDLRDELRVRDSFPPGPTDFDFGRTRRFLRDPLPILLGCYERYGPVFSLRLLHMRDVFVLGPEANHYVTVSHAGNFHWREGSFGDLIPLLGDGLLTIDGAYHDRARRIMMPAFHRERIEAAVEAMVAEASRALDSWRPGEVVDVYEWMRRLAMRIAMRALLGLDPDDHHQAAAAAAHFERALAYYGTDAHVRLLRGPGTPWRRMMRSRRVLDEIVYGEIAVRRARPDPDRSDVLSLLLEARDEDGSGLSDEEVRDQVMTLMFAGHDTSTSTLTFLLYELARHPEALAQAASESERVLGGRAPTADQLDGRALPWMEMILDETLRLYPPAWVGPRRAVRGFELAGQHVPAGAYVNYCSWASHRIPEVFPDPEAFVPERFARQRKAELPKGSYVPFGGGSRICIGKRFGQTEVRAVATMLVQRFRPELLPGHRMTVRQMPTLGPRGGLPIRIYDR
jgi:cytochrome P450